MADPVTAVAMAAQAGSSLLSARSAIAEGTAARTAGEFNAQMSERSAKIAEQQAEQIKRASEFDIARFREDFSDIQASTGTAFRYNGFIATSGTPLQVLLDNAQEADEEIALRRYNASIDQQAALESATEQRLAARLERMRGAQAQRAGYFRAASSLLSAGSKIAQMGS